MRRAEPIRTACLAVVAGLAAGLAYTAVQAASAPPVTAASCGALQGRAIPASAIRLPTGGARIVAAALVPAEGQPNTPNYVPEHCAVSGEIAPVDRAAGTIKFGVAMPVRWNGKAMQIGGNGMLGFVPWLAALNRNGAGSPGGPTYPPNAPYPIAQGYATYGGDSGHVVGNGRAPGGPHGVAPSAGQATVGGPPPGPPDYSWAANDETWRNFAYEHIRKDHDAAFAVMQMLYGRKPEKTYFMGESHGGRQSAQAIARYGADYDGVLISVPLVYLTELWLYDLRNARAHAEPGGWVPQAKLRLVEAETVRRCDELDGLKDGVVLNHVACTRAFDPVANPTALAGLRCAGGADTGEQCLSDAQIRTINTIRSRVALPYPAPGGLQSYPGAPVGAESTHNFPSPRTQPEPANVPFGFLGLFRARLHEPNLTVAQIDPVRLRAGLQRFSQELDPPADWSAYLRRGGKVIFHSASTDFTTNANGHAAYYEAMVRASGGQGAVDRGVRFYVTPIGDHGSRSFSFPDRTPQPRQMNLVSLLTDWVENGKAPPDAVEQVLMDTNPPFAVSKSRPLCRYPAYPRYRGQGDPAQAASYRCTQP